MFAALNIAATGMKAINHAIEATANNLANHSTTAYKKDVAYFADLGYNDKSSAGVNRSVDGVNSRPDKIGSGSAVIAVKKDHSIGDAKMTNNKFHMAILGIGFFLVLQDGKRLFTRAGAFTTNKDGKIVMEGNGYQLGEGAIIIPPNNVQRDTFTIRSDGEVFVKDTNNPMGEVELGNVKLYHFMNESELEPVGGNMFIETGASGEAIEGTPGEEGYGSLQQGALEQSNINSIEAITALIQYQRSYEMCSKVLKASDGMLKKLVDAAA